MKIQEKNPKHLIDEAKPLSRQDFILFNGKWRIWGGKHVNESGMNIYIYFIVFYTFESPWYRSNVQNVFYRELGLNEFCFIA